MVNKYENNSQLVELFEKVIIISKANRIEKLINAPIQLLYSKVLEIISLLLDKPIEIRATTFFGEKMFVVIPEVVSLNIYRYGFFEEGLTKMILEYLKPGMTFFDIGAHFGYFTLLGANIVGEHGQVHSFEPTPSTYEVLIKNVENKKNIITNNKAVYSKKSSLAINDFGFRYSAFNSIFSPRLPGNIVSNLPVNQFKVESVTIDEYVEKYNLKPDFVKIDAESAEYEIIVGMEKTIEEYHPMITVEVGDYNVSQDVPKSKEIIKHLVGRGYEPIEYCRNKFRTHAIKERYEYGNILFLSER